MSERLKYELAEELGVGDVVRRDGGSFGNVTSKNCGNMVRLAIERAGRSLANDPQRNNSL